MLRRLALSLALAVFLAACGGSQGKAGSTAPAASPTPPSVSAALARAVQELEQAQRYRFSVQEVHYWSYDGQEQEWRFQGEGEAKRPGFTSRLEGPADTIFIVQIADGKVSAWDTRGEVVGANTAFGGPRPGAAPYTVISYLRNYGQVGDLSIAEVDGRPAYRVTFEPSLEKMAALDTSHAQAMAKVQSVKGELWIGRDSGTPIKEKVEVELQGPAAKNERISATIDFLEIHGG